MYNIYIKINGVLETLKEPNFTVNEAEPWDLCQKLASLFLGAVGAHFAPSANSL